MGVMQVIGALFVIGALPDTKTYDDVTSAIESILKRAVRVSGFGARHTACTCPTLTRQHPVSNRADFPGRGPGGRGFESRRILGMSSPRSAPAQKARSARARQHDRLHVIVLGRTVALESSIASTLRH